jgi:hypothetical protein
MSKQLAITGPDDFGNFSVVMPDGKIRTIQYEDQLDAIEVECGDVVSSGDGLLKIRPRPRKGWSPTTRLGPQSAVSADEGPTAPA